MQIFVNQKIKLPLLASLSKDFDKMLDDAA
jgi:hypothetical protein